MRRLIFILFPIMGFSQSTEKSITHVFPGINDWDQTIEKASKENKIMMVDLSTEWCGWCKAMEKDQFKDPEVLVLVNSKFNSYILDAEKDSIGQLLKLKYGISAYPSFLFFTPKGDYIETLAGAMPKEYLIPYLRDSIDLVPMLRPGIPSGLKFQWPEFVVKELKAKFRKSTPSDSVLNQFFKTCNYRKFEDFNVCRFYPGNIPDFLLYHMFENQEWLNNNYGSDIMNDLLSTSINWKAYKQIQDSNWRQAWIYMNLYKEHFPQNEWELFNVKLYYFTTKIEVDSLIELGIQFPSFVSDHIAAKMIDFVCTYGNNTRQFLQARLWNKSMLEKATEYKFAKYQAQISYKLSEFVEASKWAQIALSIANKEGIDVSEDQELLQKIRSSNQTEIEAS